ncbi:MAG: phosphohydrolase [Firmicutes bacterium]|nr:phosphohydrolase [Bacillota bacterium]
MAVSECQPGDVAADAVFGRRGTVLAERGEVLTQAAIDAMRQQGLDVVPIEWPGWQAIHPNWWMPEQDIRALRDWVEHGPSALSSDGLVEARRLARTIAERLGERQMRPFEWIPLYRGGNPALVAWMNVIGLTVKLTLATDYRWVEDYALAAVLLGLEWDVPAAEVAEPSQERRRALAERIRPMSSIAATTRAALAQHHARWDGSGDPPLAGDKIYHGARILGLAELVNLLLYRTDDTPLPINEVLEWAAGGAGIEFPLDLIKALQRTVAPYPVGTVVQLGNGELGVVLDNPHDWPSRPLIRLLNGPERGRPVSLKAPEQHVRVITGFYHKRELPS